MNNFDEKCDNDGRKVMGKKIRLAVFGQKRWLREGGVEIVVKELCTRMVQQGCQVTCYNRSGHHVSGSEYDCVDKTEYKGISLKYVPTIEKKGARDIIGLVPVSYTHLTLPTNRYNRVGPMSRFSTS